MKGHTFKRCPCGTLRDGQGRRVNCPKRHGSWFYAHELPGDQFGKRRQVKKGGFATERDARKALNDALGQLNRGTHVEAGRQTVGAYLDQWLDGKASLRSTTSRGYRSNIELYLRPGLGHLRLSDVREVDVERLYVALRQLGRADVQATPELTRLLEARRKPAARPLRDATIRRVHATLLSALNTAKKRKLIAHNPAIHVDVASGRRPRAVVWTEDRIEAWRLTGQRPPVAVWTAVQAGAFLDHAAGHRLYPLYHVIAYRGLRRGEAVGLRWLDVDLDGQAAFIRQQVVQLGWATEVAEPKSEGGTRTLSLDAATTAVLRAWRAVQEQERRVCGAAWQGSGFVFTREDGSQPHPKTVMRTFKRLTRSSGLPPIRLHDLRHTAASLALQAGVPLKVVSEQLGHSSLAITADTYTSVLPAAAQAAAAEAGGVPRVEPQRRPQSVPIEAVPEDKSSMPRTVCRSVDASVQLSVDEPAGGCTARPLPRP